ncbi:MAG: hypothetical protein ACRELE_02680 [Gemmatimonadales bacterium]
MLHAAGLRRLGAGLVTAIAAVVVVVLVMGRFTGRGGGPPTHHADTLRIGTDSSVTILPARFRQFEFWLPAGICTFAAQIHGVAGGDREFEALILADDEFREWSAVHQGGSVQSGRRAVWAPRITLVGPGEYHLVVSNLFSSASYKVVTVDGKVICP